MRHKLLVFGLLLVTALPGCGKKPKPVAPAPPPAPAAPPPAPAPPPDVVPQEDDYKRFQKMTIDELNQLGLLQDIHFDYDKSDIREGDRQILSKNAEVLKKFDFLLITVEGHCDERGTVEYNLALGERRSKAASDYLVSLGVPANRIKTVSYGKEVPLCTQSSEDCWARNRRGHFVITGKSS